MSVYSVNRIQQIMDCLLLQKVSPLIENTLLTERVEGWMCDAASKEAYRRELVFMPLRSLAGDAVAIKYAGNMSLPEWETALARSNELIENGTFPTLRTDLPKDHWNVRYIYASTFLLEQYQYNDQIGIRKGDTVLDCGACFGETALWAVQKGAKTVYAFEPNPDSYTLVTVNTQNPKNGAKIIPVPVAVGDAPGELPFMQHPDLPGSSCFHPQGNIKVPVVPIDTWCEQNAVVPDFIKMDLEGAEINAILGGQKTFARYKPRFAICLYHSLADMWRIPVLLKQICPEYKFWCRKNSPYVEFVLYGSAEK